MEYFILTFDPESTEATAVAPLVTVTFNPSAKLVPSATIFPPFPLNRAVPKFVVPPLILTLEPFVFTLTVLPLPEEYIPTFFPVVPASNFISVTPCKLIVDLSE